MGITLGIKLAIPPYMPPYIPSIWLIASSPHRRATGPTLTRPFYPTTTTNGIPSTPIVRGGLFGPHRLREPCLLGPFQHGPPPLRVCGLEPLLERLPELHRLLGPRIPRCRTHRQRPGRQRSSATATPTTTTTLINTMSSFMTCLGIFCCTATTCKFSTIFCNNNNRGHNNKSTSSPSIRCLAIVSST